MNKITIQVNEPLLSIKQYAARVGETEKVISDQMSSGFLPFVQTSERGKRFVNMTALLMLTLEAEEKKPSHNKVNWK
jgi:hypothetical protein